MFLKDHDYIQQAFMLSGSNIDDGLKDRRQYQPARNKFVDTTPGGNFYINPAPQWAPSCDIRASRFWSDQFGGMGTCYSDAIDDNADIIYIRAGVPAFNGLIPFVSNMFNTKAAYMARTGRAPGWLFHMAEAVSSVICWPVHAYAVTYQTVTWLMGIPKFKFYYSKSAMPLYWRQCTNMLNALLINMGIVPPIYRTRHAAAKTQTFDFSAQTPEERKKLANLLPGLWKTDGSVDLYYLANRATRKHIRWQTALEAKIQANANDRDSAIKTVYTHGNNWEDNEGDSPQANLKGYLKSYFEAGLGQGENASGTEVERAGLDSMDVDGDTGTEAVIVEDQLATVVDVERASGFFDSLMSHMHSELRDGGAFIGFKVNHNGSVSESFSNSFGENKISGILNSTSSAAVDARFTTGGGKTGIPILDDVIAGATDLLMGAASGSVVLGGLVDIFLGQGYIDVPQHWTGSSASLPKESYTIHLRSPYGHPVSRVQNLMIPLVCLLCLALPHSAGPQAYTSPFLIEIFSKGRSQSRLAMIDSMSVTRGVGNVGWTKDKQPLGIDVTFTYADLSPILHAPIDAAMELGDLTNPTRLVSKVMTDDNNYSDYLAVLASQGVNEQIYRSDKLARVLAKTRLDVKQWTSPTQWAATFSDSLVGEGIKAFMQGTFRN